MSPENPAVAVLYRKQESPATGDPPVDMARGGPLGHLVSHASRDDGVVTLDSSAGQFLSCENLGVERSWAGRTCIGRSPTETSSCVGYAEENGYLVADSFSQI